MTAVEPLVQPVVERLSGPDTSSVQLLGAAAARYADVLGDRAVPADIPGAIRIPGSLALLSVFDDTPALSTLLGATCRAFPHGVLVEHLSPADDADVDAPSCLRQEQFFAFGFRRWLRCRLPGFRCTVYDYRLHDYKPAPEWLNARFWANPERFTLDAD